MSDLKLFRLSSDGVSELQGATLPLERSLQTLFERNLDRLLGIRFLASEHRTTNGRIDTLGMDENFCPVIIEYKRASNENVTNQGLFYLDWLMDHRRDFEWLVLERYGKEEAAKVEWSAPRLICIAGDFTRYDEHAVKQISRNIELIRYRRFGDDLLLLDLVTTTTGTEPSRTEQPPREIAPSGTSTSVTKYKTTIEYLAAADPALTDLFEVHPGLSPCPRRRRAGTHTKELFCIHPPKELCMHRDKTNGPQNTGIFEGRSHNHRIAARIYPQRQPDRPLRHGRS